MATSSIAHRQRVLAHLQAQQLSTEGGTHSELHASTASSASLVPAPSRGGFSPGVDDLGRSILEHRARELGVPVEQVCPSCLWSVLAGGECSLAAQRAHEAGRLMRGAAPLDSLRFSCPDERERLEPGRLGALMAALVTLAPLWQGVLGARESTARVAGAFAFAAELPPGWRAVGDVLRSAQGILRATSGTVARRDSLALAFAASDLPRELTGWGAVREPCRELYPVDVLPALDAVWAAWVAYREVAP